MQVAGLFRWAPVSPQHSSCITCSIGSASRLSPSYTLHSDPLRRLEIAPSAACAPCADSTRGNFRTEQRWLCAAAANGGLPLFCAADRLMTLSRNSLHDCGAALLVCGRNCVGSPGCVCLGKLAGSAAAVALGET